MSFLKPKEAPMPQLTQQPQSETDQNPNVGTPNAGSLISTSSQGLKRKAFTRKTSLIGGYSGGQ